MKPLIYKLKTDNNGAPCVKDDMLTLAICKPGYRSVAQAGNFLFGFMGRTSRKDKTEPLVYIAEITTEPMSIQNYYSKREYRNRPDCIYKYDKKNNKFEIRKHALYHTSKDRRDKDLGKKRDAKVLLSTNFRYLGDKGVIIDKEKYPELTKLVFELNRTNHPLKKKFQKK